MTDRFTPRMDILPVAQQSGTKDDEGNSLVVGFLQFMDKQMADHPEDIVPADADQLRRIDKLVNGAERQ